MGTAEEQVTTPMYKICPNSWLTAKLCMHGEDHKGFSTKAATEALKKRKGLAVADHREDKAGVRQVNWLL